jgi:hypothetical protein
LYSDDLKKLGIPINDWTREQIEMRLGYARRLRRRLRAVKPILASLGVGWSSWMTMVALYYYYPEKLEGRKPWIRQLAEVLVACEQFEAYSNRRRGEDYYTRKRETLQEAFDYLEKLRLGGILNQRVIDTLVQLTGEGVFDRVLTEARGKPLSARERWYLQAMRPGDASCR